MGQLNSLQLFKYLPLCNQFYQLFFWFHLLYTCKRTYSITDNQFGKVFVLLFLSFFHLYCRPKHHTPCGWEVLFQSCNPFLTAYHLLLLIAIWYSKWLSVEEVLQVWKVPTKNKTLHKCFFTVGHNVSTCWFWLPIFRRKEFIIGFPSCLLFLFSFKIVSFICNQSQRKPHNLIFGFEAFTIPWGTDGCSLNRIPLPFNGNVWKRIPHLETAKDNWTKFFLSYAYYIYIPVKTAITAVIPVFPGMYI